MSSLQEFCKKYPEYCNPELYEKIVKGAQPKTQSHSTYRRIYASEVKHELVGSIVLVEGVVMDVDKREYPRRTGQGFVRVTNFNIYDKTGRILVKSLGEEYLDVNNGDIVRITGRVEEWRGTLELRVYNLERLGRVEIEGKEIEELTRPPESEVNQPSLDKKSENVGKILALLRSAKGQGKQVYYDRLIALLQKLGLEFRDIEQYVEVNEVSKPGSLEKVKVVELKE
jgi:hypothetical protein